MSECAHLQAVCTGRSWTQTRDLFLIRSARMRATAGRLRVSAGRSGIWTLVCGRLRAGSWPLRLPSGFHERSDVASRRRDRTCAASSFARSTWRHGTGRARAPDLPAAGRFALVRRPIASTSGDSATPTRQAKPDAGLHSLRSDRDSLLSPRSTVDLVWRRGKAVRCGSCTFWACRLTSSTSRCRTPAGVGCADRRRSAGWSPRLPLCVAAFGRTGGRSWRS